MPIDPRGRNGFIERYLHGEIFRSAPGRDGGGAQPFAVGDRRSACRTRRCARCITTRRFWRPACRCSTSARNSARPTSWSARRAKGAALAAGAGRQAGGAAARARHGRGRAEPAGRGVPRDLHRSPAPTSSIRRWRSAGRSRRSMPEEGRLADVVNVQTVGRSWDLWKSPGDEVDFEARTKESTSWRSRRSRRSSRNWSMPSACWSARNTSTTTAIAACGATPTRSTSTPAPRCAARLTVEDIVAVDLDGRPVDGGNVKPPLEFPIHAEVYRARPKVNAVFHTHPQWSTYLTMTGVAAEGGLRAGRRCSATCR